MNSEAEPRRTLRIGQSLELWRAPVIAARAWMGEVVLRQFAAGADTIDINAGARGAARALIEAAELVRPLAPETPLFLDSGDSLALLAALEAIPAPVVANAVALGEAAELVLLETVARAGAAAVLTPRLHDEQRFASTEELTHALATGIQRARRAGVQGALFLDCLAYPPAIDHDRWLRSLEMARIAAGPNRNALLAVGNVGHGSPARLRPWIRVITLALAHGAGASALILPVEESRLLGALRLLQGERPPTSELDAWLVDLAEAGREGAWPPPHPPEGPPPEGAPPALLEAWAVVLGAPAPAR